MTGFKKINIEPKISFIKLKEESEE